MTEKHTYILTLACDDKAGIVADVNNFLYQNDGFILESAQFGDSSTNKFFLRAEFTCTKKLDDLKAKFSFISKKFKMAFNFYDQAQKPNIVIAVTKASHCLANLLHKNETGQLNANIVGVVSNRTDLEEFTNRYNINFKYLPIDAENSKESQEQKLLNYMEENHCDLLILARYMQILSDNLCQNLQGKAINIHHSFLPGFKGARAYHQAYDRGVKLIGATAHYVTADLDEGPIIEQEVARVNHKNSPQHLTQIGQDTESKVLFTAVKHHLEHRVVINDNKTVVFG